MPTYVQLTCVICDATFEKEYKHRKHKTCGKKCSNILRQETRRKQHEPVDKECDRCGETFQDTSKKKQVSTCKPCVSAKMVESRLANNDGAYHSEKYSNTRSEMYKDGLPWANTPEHRMKNSATMKANWENEKLYQGENHWTKTEEGKQRVSEWKKGVPHTDEARRNMSIAAAKRVRENPESLHTRGRGGYREDLGQYFRSEWEAAYARYLNANDVEWTYEPRTFEITETINYTPDFYLPKSEEWVEVKGYWDETSIMKCGLFEQKYPELSLVKIDSTNYNLIEQYTHYTTKENNEKQ